MKTKLLIIMLFGFFQVKGQTPDDSCSNAPILQVDTEYTVNNLDTNQYGFGAPIDGHSANGNSVRGFWFRVLIPAGYFAENIEIYDVSNNFNPVVGLKSNCDFGYFPNTNNGNDYADTGGYGDDETFGTGITGPGSNNDGIYHIRIYHYNNDEAPPTVDFKIKITDGSTSSEADLSVYSLSIDPTTAVAGEDIDLETEIINLGDADVTQDVTIYYFIDGVEIDDDKINNSDLPLSSGDIDQEQENNYVFASGGTYNYCVTIEDHPQESNYSNNTMCIDIVVQDGTACDGIVITQQPNNQTIVSGNTATFSVVATGTSPISYQWKKNGINISGATSSTFTTEILNISDNGNTYNCDLTNCDGTVSSISAVVTVTDSCDAIGISEQPQNQTANAGNTATFSLTTTGTAPFLYQWIKNGNNISGATNSSYTTPVLTTADDGSSYSCLITNCDGNDSITSTSATLTVTSSTPSELTVETISSIFPSPELLYSGVTDPNYIKVCADGSKSTRFSLINNSGIPNNNIGFRVIPDNSDISVYGTFADGDITPSDTNNTIEALYTHATTFPNSEDFNDSRSIEIYDKSNTSNILFTIPLRIYKAPILMVHGLWGNASGFQEMENHLLNVGYNSSLLYSLNYCEFAGNSFAANKWIIPEGINTLLNTLRENDYSSGSVDIVAHSMGGIISRTYVQSHYNDYSYNENISRLITLNTPHSGSPLGNLITNNLIIPFTPGIQGLIDGLGSFPCDGNLTDGAVYDLAINSGPMIQLNQSNLNNNVVPSHTVKTTINTLPVDPFLAIIASICAPILSVSANVFIDNLHDGLPHDGVVSLLSQEGGLTGNSTELMTSQIKHIGAQDKTEVINHVSFLLQQNPSSSYFEQNGFSPAGINPVYDFNGESSIISSNLTPNSIFINTPIEGNTYNIGETVDINITSSNGINRIEFFAVDKLNENYLKDEFQLSQVNTQYTIINDTYEDIRFLALGFDNNGLVDYDIKTINVNSSMSETGIEFLNSELHVQEDFITPISINVIYSNGDRKLLTDLSNVQFTLGDTNIAEQFQTNMIKGNNLGTTTLTASYLGNSISTSVTVYESNIPMPDISSLSSNDFEQRNLDQDILIYPNPNNGNFEIKLNSLFRGSIDVEIYNNIGQIISKLETEITESNDTVNISLNNLNSGIYFVKVISGSTSKTRKIIID